MNITILFDSDHAHVHIVNRPLREYFFAFGKNIFSVGCVFNELLSLENFIFNTTTFFHNITRKKIYTPHNRVDIKREIGEEF